MKFVLPLILLFVATFSMGVNAQGNFVSVSITNKSTQSVKQLRVKSSRQAAQLAKSRFGGKVLKVQKQGSGYRVKLIKANGHIVSVYVDAITGRVSGG